MIHPTRTIGNKCKAYEKVCYASRSEAKRAADDLHEATMLRGGRKPVGREKLRAYVCGYCRHWHIGHSASSKYAKAKSKGVQP